MLTNTELHPLIGELGKDFVSVNNDNDHLLLLLSRSDVVVVGGVEVTVKLRLIVNADKRQQVVGLCEPGTEHLRSFLIIRKL